MLQAERAPGGAKAFATLITYMFRVIDPMTRDELRAKIRLLGPRAEESAMTIAEQLHEEGRREGRVTTLRNLLLFKFHRLDAMYERLLDAATPETFDRYCQRVLTADSPAAVFDD
jgi:hypothetical protein